MVIPVFDFSRDCPPVNIFFGFIGGTELGKYHRGICTAAPFVTQWIFTLGCYGRETSQLSSTPYVAIDSQKHRGSVGQLDMIHTIFKTNIPGSKVIATNIQSIY